MKEKDRRNVNKVRDKQAVKGKREGERKETNKIREEAEKQKKESL